MPKSDRFNNMSNVVWCILEATNDQWHVFRRIYFYNLFILKCGRFTLFAFPFLPVLFSAEPYIPDCGVSVATEYICSFQSVRTHVCFRNYEWNARDYFRRGSAELNIAQCQVSVNIENVFLSRLGSKSRLSES